MCLWVRSQHPICGHAFSHESPQLLQCDLGFLLTTDATRPQNCANTERSAKRPLLVPQFGHESKSCGAQDCAYSLKGPVWCCCKCGAVTSRSAACRACKTAVCSKCVEVAS